MTDDGSRIEEILTDLANARDADALQRFYDTWETFSREAKLIVPPGFLRDEDANMPDHLRPVSFLAYLLRRLWVGDEEAMTKLERILLPTGQSLTTFFRLDWRWGRLSYQPQYDVL